MLWQQRCEAVFNLTRVHLFDPGSDEEEADGLEILMEAPEGFRNSDEDHFSESQVNVRIWSVLR